MAVDAVARQTPPFITSPELAAADGLVHGFFGREGGVSSGIYASLNAGLGSGDAPEAVTENRARIAAALGANTLLSCYQVHSPHVVHVTAPWTERPEADAMVTRTAGIGLCILTADCVPVLLADPEAAIVGAAHAGWKGALSGVLERTVEAMEALGARRSRILAAIGPAIGPESYEVGPDLEAAFIAADPGHSAFFTPGKGDRLQFDLPAFCAQALERAGLAAPALLRRDTCALETHYFSNRRRNKRGEADYGRNASVILLQR
jgi:YfiH family protein